MSEIPQHVMKAAADAHAEFAKSSVRDNLTTIIALAIAKAVEAERLRFEGDLDKWMKIIGAGITGFQPEAYAVMDMACEELVRLRTTISQTEQRARREALEEAAKLVENTAHEGMHASMWRGKFMSAASRIRALIPSEPHDAEGRE